MLSYLSWSALLSLLGASVLSGFVPLVLSVIWCLVRGACPVPFICLCMCAFSFNGLSRHATNIPSRTVQGSCPIEIGTLLKGCGNSTVYCVDPPASGHWLLLRLRAWYQQSRPTGPVGHSASANIRSISVSTSSSYQVWCLLHS